MEMSFTSLENRFLAPEVERFAGKIVVGYATINSATKAMKETKETKLTESEGVEKRHENWNLELFPPAEQPFPDP